MYDQLRLYLWQMHTPHDLSLRVQLHYHGIMRLPTWANLLLCYRSLLHTRGLRCLCIFSKRFIHVQRAKERKKQKKKKERRGEREREREREREQEREKYLCFLDPNCLPCSTQCPYNEVCVCGQCRPIAMCGCGFAWFNGQCVPNSQMPPTYRPTPRPTLKPTPRPTPPTMRPTYPTLRPTPPTPRPTYPTLRPTTRAPSRPFSISFPGFVSHVFFLFFVCFFKTAVCSRNLFIHEPFPWYFALFLMFESINSVAFFVFFFFCVAQITQFLQASPQLLLPLETPLGHA